MLIDCDTCTVRGQGCDDCVVTVLLGAPPGWRGSDPTVVPLTRRAAVETAPGERRPARGAAGALTGPPVDVRDDRSPAGDAPESTGGERDVRRIDTASVGGSAVVELDEVEHRAVRALADFGLVPPLRHQDASTPEGRHVS